MDDILGFDPSEEQTDEFISKPKKAHAAQVRGFSVSQLTDEKKLITWMTKTLKIPIEAIDNAIIERSYAAMIWMFRSAAVRGDLKQTRAIEAWLNWAKPIIASSQRERKNPPTSPGSANFGPRTPTGDEESK